MPAAQPPPNATARTDDEALDAVARDPAVLRETLPGAAEVDPELLEDLVGQINRLYVTRSIATAREIAERVVELLALGDLEGFLRVAGVHATWRALKKRKDLQMSFSQIWSSIGVLDQLRKLPDGIADALPITHHKRLLVVKDDAARVALATTAVSHNLSADELTAAIHAAGAAEPTGGRGRKRLHPIAKAVRAAAKASRTFAAGVASDAALEPEDVDRLVALLDEHDREVALLREHLTSLRNAAES